MAAPIYKGGRPFFKPGLRYKNNVVGPFSGTGAPTNGTSGTGAGVAGPGSFYIDTTNAVGAWYFNSNTKASPTWTAFGSTAGAATPSSVTASGTIVSTGTAGVGYGTGAGGTITQGTSKATTVILNKITGEIVTFNDNLASGAEVTFTVTNSVVGANDVILVMHKSGGTLGSYSFEAHSPTAATNFKITISNLTAGGLAEALTLQFVIIKSVVS